MKKNKILWSDCIIHLNNVIDFELYEGLSKLHAEINTLRTNLVKTENFLENANLPKQIVHVDFSRSNVLFRKNALPIVVDFEIARMDWRIIDVVNGLSAFCVRR